MKECLLSFDVLKMQCHKIACQNDDGELPKMIGVASKKENIQKGQRRKYYQSSDERGTETEISNENGSDQVKPQ